MANLVGLWEIAILALLCEEAMHPYQMQQLLRERHKDEILVLKRGSLYHAINRLVLAGLIAVASSGREGRRPERTTYRIRAAGRKQLVESLREMISVPQREPSEFLAAVSFLVYLKPAAAIAKLATRALLLEKEIHAIKAGLRAAAPCVQRIHLVESEYLLAMREAELKWVRGLVGELRSAKLNWNLQEMFRHLRAARKAAALRKNASGAAKAPTRGARKDTKSGVKKGAKP